MFSIFSVNEHKYSYKGASSGISGFWLLPAETFQLITSMSSFYQSLVHERAGTSIICQTDTFCGLAVFFHDPSPMFEKKKKKRSAASLLTDSPLIPFIPTCEWLRGSCSRGHFPTADLNGCDGRNHTLPKEIRGTVNAWQCRPSPQLCHQTTSVNSKAEIGDVTLMRLNSPDPHGWLLFWSGHILSLLPTFSPDDSGPKSIQHLQHFAPEAETMRAPLRSSKTWRMYL